MQLLLGIPLELVHKGFEVGMVYLSGVLAGKESCNTSSGFVKAMNSHQVCLSRSWLLENVLDCEADHIISVVLPLQALWPAPSLILSVAWWGRPVAFTP